MASIDTIDTPGGWMVQVTTLGVLPVIRTFYVYELDQQKAIALAEAQIPVTEGETAAAVLQLNVHELIGWGMSPGDVKQHV